MNIKRRLVQLENRPFRRPIPKTSHAMNRELQQKLCLPIPEASTPEEHAEALRLLVDGTNRTRIDRGDTGGLDALREYALSLHAKYGTEPG